MLSTGQRIIGGKSFFSLHPVLANNSLNRTLSGSRRKPGLRQSYHRRKPGLRRLPARTG